MFDAALDMQEWSQMRARDLAGWIALDIETGNAPEEFIQAKIADWTPPGNVTKPETVEARRKEAADKIREKSALLDGAPILCVAIHSQNDRLIFNGMDSNPYQIDGWTIESLTDEHQMLVRLRGWLDTKTDPYTTLVGHNLLGFDLPKLRIAYLRNRLRPPYCLSVGTDEHSQPTTDTMRLFARRFAVESNGQPFVSLDKVATALGLPRPKSTISGSAVPAMHERGEHLPILTYCAIDTTTTAAAYELMMGHSAELR